MVNVGLDVVGAADGEAVDVGRSDGIVVGLAVVGLEGVGASDDSADSSDEYSGVGLDSILGNSTILFISSLIS